MTRKDLIERILEGNIAGTQGTDFGLGITPQEFHFQNWVGGNFNKRKKSKFKNPPIHMEGEDKWLRMKAHIAGSAGARGISGERRKAYIYGAMRARGWKPKRERVNETMATIGRIARRTGKGIKKQYRREVKRPIRGLMRASRYKTKAGREIARGNVARGLEMASRADKVIKAHRPVVAAAAAGLAVGFAGLPVPGGAELSAVAMAKATRGVTRTVLRRRARATA